VLGDEQYISKRRPGGWRQGRPARLGGLRRPLACRGAILPSQHRTVNNFPSVAAALEWVGERLVVRGRPPPTEQQD
jgi:hypothetical protein